MGTVTVASAGHFAPLLITRSGARYADVAAGLPIGVHGEGEYREHSFSVEQGGTLVAFTDGLVERRGEVIDAGLERLRASADGRDGPLGEMLSGLVGDLAHDHVPDDTAIIGLQWQL